MKYKELINKSAAELTTELHRVKAEVLELSVKLRSGQVKNVKQVQGLKKDIARILTALASK